jgi:hypothetical protein
VEDGEAAGTGVEGGQAAGAGPNSTGNLQTRALGTFLFVLFIFFK